MPTEPLLQLAVAGIGHKIDREPAHVGEQMNPGGLVPTAILIITRPVRFEVGEPCRDLDFDFEGVQAVQAKIDRAVELPLAALLGTERGDYVLLGLVWSTKSRAPKNPLGRR